MRVFTLKKEGAIRLNKGELDLFSNQIEESIKSCVPGELVLLSDKVKRKDYYAFMNPLAMSGNEINLINNLWGFNLKELGLEEYLNFVLKKAFELRDCLMNYKDNSRLFYGNEDGLPGLIVDSYQNYVIIQINSAGVDQHRNFVKSFYQKLFKNKNIVFLDNEKYRERQGLPIFEKDPISDDLDVLENNFRYKIRSEVLQKVGYYYDHRENRLKAERLISSANIKPALGIDLFSYIGSWGMHLLRAGVQNVEFIDQGNFEVETKSSLELNGFSGRGHFYRENVFKYLDKAISENKTYDVICSDPPAFAKSPKEKKAAIDGYTKLHRKILKLCSKEAIFIAASCTHYVSHADFQATVVEASQLEDVNITLVDMGIQGADHPSQSTNKYNNYIKFYLYLVRKK